jgi:hypothetical protein
VREFAGKLILRIAMGDRAGPNPKLSGKELIGKSLAVNYWATILLIRTES